MFEHFFAYSNTDIVNRDILRAEKFYKNFLIQKEALALPEHRINIYRYQVENHLAKLEEDKSLVIDKKPLQIIENGKSITEFIAQLK